MRAAAFTDENFPMSLPTAACSVLPPNLAMGGHWQTFSNNVGGLQGVYNGGETPAFKTSQHPAWFFKKSKRSKARLLSILNIQTNILAAQFAKVLVVGNNNKVQRWSTVETL